MKLKIKLKGILIFIAIFIISIFFVPAGTLAAPNLIQEAINKTHETADETGVKPFEILGFTGNIIKLALSTVGSVFFLLTLYGGFIWMTARGEEDQAAKAKEIIKAAIIGLAITVSAYAITVFITNKVI